MTGRLLAFVPRFNAGTCLECGTHVSSLADFITHYTTHHMEGNQ